MTDALVIGGGVAGPVTAMALQQAGIDAVVYEAHGSAADDHGLFFTLQLNGVDALRAVGAADVVADLGFPTASIRFRSGGGRYLGEMGIGRPLSEPVSSKSALSRSTSPSTAITPTSTPRPGTVGVTLRRADLYRALRDEAVRRGIRVEYGRRLVDAVRTPDGIRAEFDDGTHASADLLVGADGVHSRVRRIIDPGATPARYLPMLNIGGYAPALPTPAEPGQYEMIFGKRAFFLYAVAPDGAIWWGANPPLPDEPTRAELAEITTTQWRARLHELFDGDRGPAADIIAATPGELRAWATYDLPTLTRWHRDRMIVIGDAAHATSPSSGQGASLAIEDAVELARCLRDLPDVDAAFAAYERLRRERVEAVVAEGAKWSNTKVAGPVQRVVRDAVLPMVFAWMARSTRADWVHHHHIEWNAPVGRPPSSGSQADIAAGART